MDLRKSESINISLDRKQKKLPRMNGGVFVLILSIDLSIKVTEILIKEMVNRI